MLNKSHETHWISSCYNMLMVITHLCYCDMHWSLWFYHWSALMEAMESTEPPYASNQIQPLTSWPAIHPWETVYMQSMMQTPGISANWFGQIQQVSLTHKVKISWHSSMFTIRTVMNHCANYVRTKCGCDIPWDNCHLQSPSIQLSQVLKCLGKMLLQGQVYVFWDLILWTQANSVTARWARERSPKGLVLVLGVLPHCKQ